MPIEPNGIPVDAETDLNPGDKVQWNGRLVLPNGETTSERWWNGEVIECNPNGTVKIHYFEWRSEWDESVSRKRLRLVKN